jgi:SAM-dependent methyltransferase
MKNSARNTFFPESNAGGFTRIDGSVQFYTRVNALLESQMTLLDFGAGRGAEIERLKDQNILWKCNLIRLKGKVQKVTGIDIDSSIYENPNLDECIVVNPEQVFPIADESIDLIIADNTLEHLQNPEFVAQEFTRILKPGGWICARTPNRFGYIGIGANLVPNTMHAKLTSVLQLGREEKDVFPTVYRINTMKRINKMFTSVQFKNFSYTWNPEPAYFRDNLLAWGLMLLFYRIAPSMFGTVLMVFLQKKYGDI